MNNLKGSYRELCRDDPRGVPMGVSSLFVMDAPRVVPTDSSITSL